MFAHADDVEPRFIGEDRHVNHLPHPLAWRRRAPGARIGDQIAESVEAEFHMQDLIEFGCAALQALVALSRVDGRAKGVRKDASSTACARGDPGAELSLAYC